MTPTIPLGELVTIRGGGTPSRNVPKYWNGNMRWATVKDFKSTELSETQESITEEGVRRSATNVIPAGAVIVPTRMAVGKAAINTIDLAINQDLKALLPTDEVDERFLLHFMLSKSDFLEAQAQGATVKGIKLDLLRSLPFPQITRNEQRKIAATLDRAGAMRRKRQDLLLLAEQLVRNQFLEMFGHPLSPNRSLPTERLENLCDLFAGNSLPSGEEFHGQKEGHLLLKVSDLNAVGNEEVITTAKAWLPMGSSLRGCILAPRQAIVFPKRGGAIATNKKRILGRPSILDPNLMAVAPKANSRISFQFVRSWFGLLDLSSISNGSSIPQLNKRDLAPLEMVVPTPEGLQVFEGIVMRTSEMIVQLRRDLANANNLFDALSQRAFCGEP